MLKGSICGCTRENLHKESPSSSAVNRFCTRWGGLAQVGQVLWLINTNMVITMPNQWQFLQNPMWHSRMVKLYHPVHPMNTTMFLWTHVIKSVFCVGLVTIKMILLSRYVLPVCWNEMFLHCSRISCLTSRIICLATYLGMILTGMSHTLLLKNGTISHLQTTVSISTRFFMSITLHMTCDKCKIHWTHGPTPTSWHSHMKMKATGTGNIHTGMGKFLECFMQWSSIVVQGLAQWIHSTWSFCGYGGMVRIWTMQEGGKQSTSIALVL